MARSTLTKTVAPGGYAAAGVALTIAASTGASGSSGNQFVSTGKELVIAQNTDASPHTVTITSSNDPFGRAGTITAESIAAGAFHIFGPFPTPGWQQGDGMVYLEATDITVKFAVVVLP